MSETPVSPSGERRHIRIAGYGVTDIVLDEPVRTWPKEEIDRARDLMSMALAEAGHPCDWEWNAEDGQYQSKALNTVLAIPYEVMEKARMLVLDALGRGYTLKSDAGQNGGSQEGPEAG